MMFDNPLISIIVPIYNTELYLADCLASIAKQSYQNIEVILINDGSTDDSKDIAEQMCEEDERFKLINQTNSGVASARQIGLERANGQFIIHCDSDDLMTEKAIEYLYKAICKNKSNVAVGAYIEQTENDNLIIVQNAKNREELLLNVLTGKYRGSLWDKLIDINVCKSIKFDSNINYMEDLLFLVKVLAQDNVKVSTVDDIVYFYRKRNDSYTNKISHKSILDSIYVTENICNIISNSYNKNLINHIKNKLKPMILLNSNKSARSFFPESNPALLIDNRIPFKHKAIIILDWWHMNVIIDTYKYLSNKKCR